MLTTGLQGNKTPALAYVPWTTAQSKNHSVRGRASDVAFIDFFPWSALTSWKTPITKTWSDKT